MGDVNDEIKTLMNRFEEKGENHDFARYINVFFVRGIFSKLCFPIGCHPSMGFTGDQLFPLVWEATRILEGLGLKVRSWTCDGATPNRKFLKIDSKCQDRDYYTTNVFDQNKKIYSFSDVTHLLKTTRNNIKNSHGNINSRNLMVIHFYWFFILSYSCFSIDSSLLLKRDELLNALKNADVWI